jgi:hypothetical protein
VADQISAALVADYASGLVVVTGGVVVARTGSEQAIHPRPAATSPQMLDDLSPVVVMVSAAQRWARPAMATTTTEKTDGHRHQESPQDLRGANS